MTGQTLKIQAPNKVSDLDSLAKQIDAAHVEVRRVLLTSVQLAAEAGHLLAQAKALVPFGKWEAWVKKNTAVSPRTARGYMQVERLWAEADTANRRRVADLGLRALLTELASPVAARVPQSEEEPSRAPEPDRLAATMESVREADYRSGASRRITGDSIQSAANLGGINREWDKLDTAGRDKFLSEKLRTHGHPDHSGQEIIDVGT